MAAVPSQRRRLPQPYAAPPRDGDHICGVDAVQAEAATSEMNEAAATAQQIRPGAAQVHAFRKSAPPPSQRMTSTTTAAAAVGNGSALRAGAPASRGNGAARPLAAGSAAVLLPWSSHTHSPPDGNAMRSLGVGSGLHGDVNGAPARQPQPYNGNSAADVAAYMRSRVLSPPPPSSSSIDSQPPSPPPAVARTQPFTDPAVVRVASSTGAPLPPHRPDSSLVFALGEDSELKVLAGRVGPQQQQQQPSRPVPFAPVAQGALPHTPCPLRRGRSAEDDDEACDGVGVSGAAAAPSVRGVHPVQQASVRRMHGSASVAQQQQQQQQPPVSQSTQRSAGAPAYRSMAHELRSPPALHVCPGAIPGSTTAPQVIASGTAATTAPNVDVAAPRPPVAIPTLKLYTLVNGGGRAGTSNGAMARSNVSSAAPEGSGSVRSRQSKPRSVDARSQHSGTPPPSTTDGGTQADDDALPLSPPVPKNFTQAQRDAVLREVEEDEFYLDYPAVRLPEKKKNKGDAEEQKRRIRQRFKQILFGKSTLGYHNMCKVVKKCDREFHNPMHPVTPRADTQCSKRQFDRMLNAWRRQLHLWDNYDPLHPARHFLPLGTATLRDLGLVEMLEEDNAPDDPGPCTPTIPEGEMLPPPPPQQQQQQQKQPLPPQPSGVLHSIANVAAAAAGGGGGGGGDGPGEDDEEEAGGGAAHTRSPVFNGHTPTSGIFCNGIPAHLHSGRTSALEAAACTPSRPQPSEAGEGPQVDDTFFLSMNSGNSRNASPYHPAYAGSNSGVHAAHHHHNGMGINGFSHHHHSYHGSGGGPVNGRGSALYGPQHLTRNGSNAPHHGGTPGNNYSSYGGNGAGCGGPHMGLTPAHRPPSRSGAPNHCQALFNSEFELMTPSGPGSPAGLPQNTVRGGCSPYGGGAEPWMQQHRRSPTYTPGIAHGGGRPASAGGTITAANSAGTMVLTGGVRGESPVQTSELALVPSTLQSSSGGFAHTPYVYHVQSPVQSEHQQQQQPAYVTPLTRTQSRPSMMVAAAPTLSSQSSPSRSPIGLPPQQERVAIATSMAAAARSRRGSGMTQSRSTWTPPGMTGSMRPSPHTPQLHLAAAATPPATVRVEVPE